MPHFRTNRSRFPSFSVSARFSNELENIRKKLDELTRKQSMLELKWNTPRTFAKSSNEPENFRNKLDELTHNQSTLEKTLNTLRMSNSSNVHLWRIQQTVNQLKENQENIEKQQKISQQTHENEEKRGIQGSEQLIHMSTDIKDLYESIKNIHKSLAAKPSGLTQTDMDAAIASSERRIIEQIDQKVDVKFHQLEAQIAALKAFPTPMTRTDVENLIANAMQIIKPNEVKKEDSGTLNRAVNDRISRLEKQLDDLPKLISSYVTRPTVDDLIRDAISNRQVVIAPHSDSSLQNRIAFLEERSSTFLLVKDLDQIKQRLDQLEIRPAPLGRPDPLSSVVQPIPAHTTYLEDPRITSLQKQVDDHMRFLNQFGEQINILMRMKIDHSGVNQLVNASEEKTTQAVNELAKYVHRECQDPRLPGVINQLNSYSTLIQNLTNQINDLDRNKPDLKIIEKLIQDRMKQMKDKSAPSVSCNEQYDPRITDLQTQIIDQLEFIRNLEKQFERLQQFVDESERRTQASIGNLSSPMNQDLRDSKLSNILQQVHIHTNAIQDLDSRINQLPKIQPNDELREKIDDVEHEAKRAHTDLAALRRQLAQQPTSIFPSAGKVSLPKQYTAKDYQAIMPFIEVLPTFNLFAENEWD